MRSKPGRMPPTPRTSIAGVALLLAARAVAAQDPIIKPTATTITRLAAPTGLTARQLGDGRILVTWKAVAGAVGYSVWRSVPPAAIASVSAQQTDTLYYDTDVKAGSYYYYQIAALSEGGGVGLKASPPPVNAALSATGSAGTGGVAPVVLRQVVQNGTYHGVIIPVFYGGRAGLQLALERAVVTGGQASSWTQRLITRTLRAGDSVTALGDPYDTYPAGTTLRWRVFAIDSASGVRSVPAVSNDFVVPQTAVVSTSTTTAAAATPVGNVVVSMATPVTLRVGATASLTTALGGMTATRWVSLHEGIAAIDASGTATARAAGQAQILAIGRASDGSARVTLVQVTVSP
jgi:hypothetical protein